MLPHKSDLIATGGVSSEEFLNHDAEVNSIEGLLHDWKNLAGTVSLQAGRALHQIECTNCCDSAVKSIRECERAAIQLYTVLVDSYEKWQSTDNELIETICILALFDRMIYYYRDISDGRNVQMSVLATSNRPAWIKAPLRTMERILENLLTNSIKAGSSRVICSYKDGVASVEDDGPGVPPKYRELIFKKGHDSRLNKAIPGSGLGLSTARTIAAKFGYSISCVDPELIGGARFEISGLKKQVL